MVLRALAILVGISLFIFSILEIDYPSLVFSAFFCFALILFGCVGKQRWNQIFYPLSKFGYILVSIVFTICSFILYQWPPENPFFFIFIAFITLLNLKEKTAPANQIYKINYGCVAFLLSYILHEQPQELLGKWYITGILWIFSLSVLTSIFFDAKQMKNLPGSIIGMAP